MTYSRGDVYSGSWKDDMKNGEGVMSFPDTVEGSMEFLDGEEEFILQQYRTCTYTK